MERRSFLFGGLTGVGLGAGVALASQKLRAAAEDDEAKSDADEDSPKEAKPVSVPPNGEVAPSGRIKPEPPPLGPQPPDGRIVSYAQQGEDLVIANVLESLGIRRPRYLDVGAFHPTIGSNTYLLYSMGARGVLVEPNPMMTQMLRELRPEDTIVEAGIGIDEHRSAPYYLIRDRPQLNTFSQEQVDRYRAEQKREVVEKTLDMPLRPIMEVIAEHFAESPPDLVSIDVEGLDLEILRTFDFAKSRPAVFCVETLRFGTKGLVGGTLDLMREHGYVARGGSFVNTVFVDAGRIDPSDETPLRRGL